MLRAAPQTARPEEVAVMSVDLLKRLLVVMAESGLPIDVAAKDVFGGKNIDVILGAAEAGGFPSEALAPIRAGLRRIAERKSTPDRAATPAPSELRGSNAQPASDDAGDPWDGADRMQRVRPLFHLSFPRPMSRWEIGAFVEEFPALQTHADEILMEMAGLSGQARSVEGVDATTREYVALPGETYEEIAEKLVSDARRAIELHACNPPDSRRQGDLRVRLPPSWFAWIPPDTVPGGATLDPGTRERVTGYLKLWVKRNPGPAAAAWVSDPGTYAGLAAPVPDDRTRSALQAFQAWRGGLRTDGALDQPTINALDAWFREQLPRAGGDAGACAPSGSVRTERTQDATLAAEADARVSERPPHLAEREEAAGGINLSDQDLRMAARFVVHLCVHAEGLTHRTARFGGPIHRRPRASRAPRRAAHRSAVAPARDGPPPPPDDAPAPVASRSSRAAIGGSR